MHVNNVAERIKIEIPQTVQHLIPIYHLVGMAHQVLQKSVLLVRQDDLSPRAGHFMRDAVQLKIGYFQDIVLGSTVFSRQGPDPCHEFVKSERLRQVIVRSGIESPHLIFDRILGRQ